MEDTCKQCGHVCMGEECGGKNCPECQAPLHGKDSEKSDETDLDSSSEPTEEKEEVI